ncbi:hypothetical protein GMB86_00825 [Terrilactibacillus sp. BCM23-1]|uniref:YppG-like protein n=1 Tax=Terrilactibacillus tamarindi TaxID=2599694 RepID=A0A6N8CMZ9_9BACI|nr:YppG family protein [Terrilactibacillus tamarindi]MTT30557.1 hypothetical protein [Terrilactibacillus tamarindi]
MPQYNHHPQDRPVDPFTQMMFGQPYHGPYSNQVPSNNVQQQPKELPQFMKIFFNDEGKFDFNKIKHGTDTVFNVIDKTGPMIKQISPFLSMFKKNK